jgi:transcriptional regulator with XRE-family HTH domain
MWMCTRCYFCIPCLHMSTKEKIFEIIISELDWYIINNVKNLRIKKKISQVKLSIDMGLAEGAVGKIENPKERAKYNIRHLNLLAKALECSLSDLLPQKPLENDIVIIKIRLKGKKKLTEKEDNYEVISLKPLKD